MTDLNVITTKGERFTEAENFKLAKLIYKRFGNDLIEATAAWNRLLENNCSQSDFLRLVRGISIWV